MSLSMLQTISVQTDYSCCRLSVVIGTVWYNIHWKCDGNMHAAICQWSFKLRVLQSISDMATHHNVMNLYVTMAPSDKYILL
jgi:hypothetical protein